MGCKKPYAPAIVSANNNYLVVEGVINTGSDSTIIKVSRTIKLSSKATDNPVLGAVLTVESDQNTIYSLTEATDGKYISAGLNLDGSHKYRLRIKTNSGQYLSDYVEVLNSPPIDSVSYDIKGTVSGPGVNIYVSTHDNSNKVFYYRWEYQETWMFHSNFPSYFYSNGDTVLGRNMITDNITDCWANNISSTIVLGSSAKLSRDVIFDNPVISIPSTAEKIEDKYSILVKQYALSLEAYTFYTNLKKNTEQLGSIFDALPSEIEGNIHSVNNASEPVIGYITVGSTTSQRIFIQKQQLPGWPTTPFYTNCHLAFPGQSCCLYVYPPGPPNQVDAYINYLTNNNPNPLIPIDAIGLPGHPPLGYTAASRECVDCTLRGTNKKPSFWQ
ncbi:DUF4249 domain-containing protein [Mucilaginibacter sp. McL0603]|uniref:DUF4249 domain-containing protein n=1 Tax=Mucilaginibacter sp. McL0603 TaxID=3415670 RepID=UPI003CEA55AC